ncbi:MAG TPA: SRPBCC domain-containing protein [Cyclobacteriaceae bacterium]|nr:SRPBCC domain-containing protein [Cyclobacteriaceae bacterium]
MAANSNQQVVKDLANNKLTLTRNFEADVETVWDMWTRSEMLDLWWAPRPWRAETKSQSFKPGGKWLYAMVSPEGERHWSCVEYTKIEKQKSFEGMDAFSDENGVINTEMPRTNWKVTFDATSKGTKITIVMTAAQGGHIEKLLEMGFEQGITMTMDYLDEYLKTHANA